MCLLNATRLSMALLSVAWVSFEVTAIPCHSKPSEFSLVLLRVWSVEVSREITQLLQWKGDVEADDGVGDFDCAGVLRTCHDISKSFHF